jgi:RHS repeat-associated protein
MVQRDDPDTGRTTAGFDDADRMVSSTDARGITLVTKYDNLDRKTAVLRGGTTMLASWTYDTTPLQGVQAAAKGKVSTATRFVDSAQYTVTTTGYTMQYQPSGSTITIPVAETGLAGTYTYSTGYNVNGSTNSVSYPGAGDLGAESIGYRYDSQALPHQLLTFYGKEGTESTYVSDAQYNALAQATTYVLYTGTGGRVYLHREHELETGRLSRIHTQRDSVSPNDVSDVHYSYDDAGNITSMADTPAGTVDWQCFGYDYLRRLTEAWTPADSCGGDPGSGELGGPAPYWLSWTYDGAGNRRTQTDHGHTPPADDDVTTTYTYRGGSVQPHTLTGSTTVAAGGTTSGSYGYDPTGNTTSRPAASGGTQTLAWDFEGHLNSVSDSARTTTFVYDADGNRLIRRDPAGKTLYLPNQELRYDTATGVKTCTRYYVFDDHRVAQRTASGITWLSEDHENTALAAIDERTQQVTIRRQTPFGQPRGPAMTWPNEKGYLGGANDPSGLTHLGAREYDSATGRFISVDPVLDNQDPQQMNGYAYANNSPINTSDPTGELTNCGPDGVHCGMDPNFNRDGSPKKSGGGGTASKGGGRSGGGSGKSNKDIPWRQKPDGGNVPRPRKDIPWHNKPDGGVSPGRHKGGVYLYHVTYNLDKAGDTIIFSNGHQYVDEPEWSSRHGEMTRIPDIDLHPEYKGNKHLVTNFGGCLIICLNVSHQGGHLQLSGGPCICVALPGASVGYANQSVEHRENATLVGMAGPLSGSVGLRAGTEDQESSMIGSDWEADVAVAGVEGVPLPPEFGIGWGVNFQFADMCVSACAPELKDFEGGGLIYPGGA